MTTELEEQFYKTFGIEQKVKCDITKTANMCICFACPHYKNIDGETGECQNLKYPEITAGRLLQLLCIVMDEYNRNGNTFYLDGTNIEELKDDILDTLMGCIDTTCDLFETEVKQIQQLFKGEE